jgi:hypothetical protein
MHTVRPESLRPQVAVLRELVHLQRLGHRLFKKHHRDNEQNNGEAEDRPLLPRNVQAPFGPGGRFVLVLGEFGVLGREEPEPDPARGVVVWYEERHCSVDQDMLEQRNT